MRVTGHYPQKEKKVQFGLKRGLLCFSGGLSVGLRRCLLWPSPTGSYLLQITCRECPTSCLFLAKQKVLEDGCLSQVNGIMGNGISLKGQTERIQKLVKKHPSDQ